MDQDIKLKRLWKEINDEPNDSVKYIKIKLYSDLQQEYLKNGEELRQIEISGLHEKLKANVSDSLKCDLLMKLAEKFKGASIDSAFLYSNLALSLSRKSNSKHFEVIAIQVIGSIHEQCYQYDSALFYYNQSRDKAIQYQLLEDIPYSSLFNLCFYLGNYPYAMQLCLEGLPWSEKTGDKLAQANFHNVLGYISNKQGNRKEAHQQYRIYLSLAENLNDSEHIAHAYREWSAVFFDENRLDSSLKYLMKSFAIYKIVSRGQGFAAAIVNTIYKISLVYKAKKDYKKALKFALESVNILSYNNFDQPLYYINLGDIYLKLKEPKQALLNYQQGLLLAEKIKHSEDTRDAFYSLSEFYRNAKRIDSALYYYTNYVALKDSIINEKTQQNIAFMQSQFDAERKDQQIKDQETKLKKQALLRNIIVGSSVAVLLILGLFYNSYRLKQKNKFQQQLNKQQNELMNTVIVVQDKERKRIAEDLHDTLGSILSAAKLKLSAVAETSSVNGNGNAGNYEDTMNLLDEAVNEMRNISHNLLPASLLRLGLVPGLKNLMDKISSKSSLQINFIAYGFNERIDETIEVSIYRIILEAINNVVKHAKAKNVTVQLMQYDSYINILVEDDGVGFDRSVVKDQGIGLNNILSRVDYMKGKVDIDTKPKAGTVINIDIPYRQNIS